MTKLKYKCDLSPKADLCIREIEDVLNRRGFTLSHEQHEHGHFLLIRKADEGSGIAGQFFEAKEVKE